MNCVGFLILLVLILLRLSCKAQIIPKSSEKTVISNSTVRLSWTFLGEASKAGLALYFTRRRVGSEEEEIALKYRNNPAIYFPNSLPRIAIEIMPPRVTLVLTNVDERYNGKYRFNVQVVHAGGEAEVELYIAEKPIVKINCSSPMMLIEGDDFTCLCRAEGGNPPANVTWFRNGRQFGETRTENNTLTRTNVDETDNATYTCFAQSFPKHAMFNDSKPVVVQVKFKPKETTIEFTKNPAKLGTSVTMKCKSRGFPEPSYTITLNGTKTVSTEKTYTISKVGWNDTGTYNCTATNERGSDWAADFLDVTEQGPTTTSAATTAASTPKKNSGSTTSTTKNANNGTVITTDDGEGKGGLSAGAITAIALVAVLSLVIIGVVYCYKYKREWTNSCCEWV